MGVITVSGTGLVVNLSFENQRKNDPGAQVFKLNSNPNPKIVYW